VSSEAAEIQVDICCAVSHVQEKTPHLLAGTIWNQHIKENLEERPLPNGGHRH
jgi:hypothetical protein